MLTVTIEALSIIRERGMPVFLELPKLITGCCFDLQECPAVRFGDPRNMQDYEKRIIQDATVFVPRRLADIHLTIAVSSFLGIRRLVVEGWRYF